MKGNVQKKSLAMMILYGIKLEKGKFIGKTRSKKQKHKINIYLFIYGQAPIANDPSAQH